MVVIRKMHLLLVSISLLGGLLFAQDSSEMLYKKRVLDQIEINFLNSYYVQEGENASVTGGVGNEKLTDFTPSFVVAIPLNDDDILTIDLTTSNYTSASSSNGNPFDVSGSSSGYDDDDNDDDDDEDYDENENSYGDPKDIIGSPWVASSGASKQDVWSSLSLGYESSSDDRNTVKSRNISISKEYDYSSVGIGGGITKLYNQKNSSFSVSGNIYFDRWDPIYPTELKAYSDENGNLDAGFFYNVDIKDVHGNVSLDWRPINDFSLIKDDSRNSYSLSISASQIIGKNSQASFFLDVIKQEGWLANPLQRVYFSDVSNYFIGNESSISNYTSKSNRDVFHLSDDIERLPSSRIKIPFGFRFNYFINENITVRNYYRYYSDDWGVRSNTINLEVPYKISDSFTLYPSFRHYDQTQSDYFAPYDMHLSTSDFYTSDYDLSSFNAKQYGIGLSYKDIFTERHIFNFGLKSIDLKFSNYQRSNGFNANIFSESIQLIESKVLPELNK